MSNPPPGKRLVNGIKWLGFRVGKENMDEQNWTELLERLTLVRSSPCPVNGGHLDAFENESGIVLPQSYRAYASVFGAGEISECYRVAVPGYAGEGLFFNLRELNSEMHTGLDWEEYSPDPDQFSRAVVFANDVARNIYFWDTKLITDDSTSEYGVFVKHEDWETKKLSDTFWELVTQVWLGERHNELFGDIPRYIFQPAT